MNLALWIVQGVLAAVFAVSGSAKISMSRERLLETGQSGIAPFPMPVIRVVAGCELLAVAGLILPLATGIAPVLTPLAAIGLAVVMVGAAIAHTSLREPLPVTVNLVLLAGCVLVAVGRFTA